MLVLFIFMITCSFISSLIQYYIIERRYINKIQEIYDKCDSNLYSITMCNYDLLKILDEICF